MNIAGKLEMIRRLLGGTETHTCEQCGETHEHTIPALISPEEALKLLSQEETQEIKKDDN